MDYGLKCKITTLFEEDVDRLSKIYDEQIFLSFDTQSMICKRKTSLDTINIETCVW